MGKAPPTQTNEAKGSPPPRAQASALEGQKQLQKQQRPPASESPTSSSRVCNQNKSTPAFWQASKGLGAGAKARWLREPLFEPTTADTPQQSGTGAAW